MEAHPLATTLRPFLPILALAGLAAGATAQAPNLAPAAFLPGSPVVGPATGTQQTPALAAGGGITLLVYEDRRAGDSDLFAVRLDASGSPLDPLPFPITKDPGTQTSPQVVWNGTNFLVVYSNQYDPGSGYFAYQVAALRVSPQGQVLDAAPIVVSADSTGGGFAAASDGQGWAVLYTGYSAGNNGVSAKRISAGGAILDPAGVVVFPASYYIVFGLEASYTQGQYLFTWSDSGMRARRFTPQLQAIDPAPVLLQSTTGAIASSGSAYFVAWVRQNPNFTTEVVGSMYDPGLSGFGLPPIAVSGVVGGVSPSNPAVTWDGNQWVVSWLTTGTQAARVARVSRTGVVLDPGGILVPENAPNNLYTVELGPLPAGGALFAWSDYRYSSQDVFGVSFTASGVLGTERVYTTGSESLRSPRVTAGPDQYLVTYRAEAGNGTRVLAQRVDAFGVPLDPEPIVVASASHLSLFAGGAAWNGSVYLVTWSDSTQGRIFARRMLPDGTFLDASPIPVLLGGGADVAALGDDFLVTGLRAPFNPQYVFSYGARVHGIDGVVLDDPAIGIGSSFATRARVVTLGGRWLVVTERHWTHDENQSDVVVSFVEPTGVVASSQSVMLMNIQDWGIVDVASSGTSALVVAQSGSNWTNADVFARRILPNGTVTGGTLNLTGGDPRGQSRPSVVWTGAEYVVSYQTYQNNVWFYDYEPDVYGVRVTEGGVLVDGQGFALWNGEDYEVTPDAASLGNGRALLAAAAYTDGAHASYRISARTMRPAGLANYGSGTPGCEGPQRMDANEAPKQNASTFVLLTDRVPPSTLGLGLVTDLQDLAGSDPFGIDVQLHVDLLAATELIPLDMLSDAAGHGSVSVPIPNDPLLVGRTYYAQSLWAWLSCTPSAFGLSTSDGLEIVVQAP